nr:hypothetical protein [Moraxella osloensis]
MKKMFAYLLLFSFISPANAIVKRIVNVSYEKDYGYSEEVPVEVTFLTGKELNKATDSYKYSDYDNYGLIWFAKDEVALLKLDSYSSNYGSEELDNEAFKRIFQFSSYETATQVNSTNNRKWRLEAKDYLKWIDPRVERQ